MFNIAKGGITKLVKEFVETERDATFKTNEISFSDMIEIIQRESFTVKNSEAKRFVEEEYNRKPVCGIIYH